MQEQQPPIPPTSLTLLVSNQTPVCRPQTACQPRCGHSMPLCTLPSRASKRPFHPTSLLATLRIGVTPPMARTAVSTPLPVRRLARLPILHLLPAPIKQTVCQLLCGQWIPPSFTLFHLVKRPFHPMCLLHPHPPNGEPLLLSTPMIIRLARVNDIGRFTQCTKHKARADFHFLRGRH
jgi:hypothetical protein